MIHKAKDLSAEQRLAIESLLGRSIAEQEEISIRALPQTLPVSSERRRAIIEELRKHFAAVDGQRRPVSAQEADEIIDEALRSTRPDFRAVH
jgi:hypothetical protein